MHPAKVLPQGRGAAVDGDLAHGPISGAIWGFPLPLEAEHVREQVHHEQEGGKPADLC